MNPTSFTPDGFMIYDFFVNLYPNKQ